MIEEKFSIPRKSQRLLFNGKNLIKNSTLEDNKISTGAILYLI